MLARAVLAAVALALLTSCEAYKRSNTGVSATEKTVLYDFRVASVPPEPKLDPAIRRQVLSTISPRYYTLGRDCPKSNDGVVLHVNAVAQGSFTAPAVQETAYLVDYLKCSEPADRVSRLTVFAADRPVTIAEVPDFTLLKTYDLNRDGKNELLLASGYARMGGAGTSVRLVQFEGRNLITVENFGSVYDDNCGMFVNISEEQRKELHARGVDPLMNAVVLSYLPRPGRQMPSFTAQRFRSACPPEGQPPHWTEVSR